MLNLSQFTGGWLVGSFDPSLIKQNDIEVAIKKYKAGHYEPRHVHNQAIEYTVIISGKALMNNIEYFTDDIIVVNPTESTDFLCLEDTVTCVIKSPSIPKDKFLV